MSLEMRLGKEINEELEKKNVVACLREERGTASPAVFSCRN